MSFIIHHLGWAPQQGLGHSSGMAIFAQVDCHREMWPNGFASAAAFMGPISN
jgi:hypothetical protein